MLYWKRCDVPNDNVLIVLINLCSLPCLLKKYVTLQSGLASLMDAENKCHERSRLIQQSQQALLTMVMGQDNMAANNEQVCDVLVSICRGDLVAFVCTLLGIHYFGI